MNNNIKNKVMKPNEAPENYPIQFKDKIDEYLWKEHQILGGCCSSIENLKYSIVREVAEKLTDSFIEKVQSFLNKKDDRDFYTIGYIKRHLQEIIKEIGL